MEPMLQSIIIIGIINKNADIKPVECKKKTSVQYDLMDDLNVIEAKVTKLNGA